MRRLAEVPIQYVAAVVLLVGLAVGIYALKGSQTSSPSAATTPVAAAPRSATAPGSATAPAVKPASGGATSGQALLARARLAFAHVPAITTTLSIGNKGWDQFRSVLRNDRIVAEAFVGKAQDGQTTELVVRAGSPTYAHEPGTKCWRPLAASSPQSISDIGTQFPPALPAGANVEPTLPTRGGWLVPVQVGRDNTMFTIDARTHLVTSVLSSSGAIRVGGDVQTLSSVPALPQPEPRC